MSSDSLRHVHDALLPVGHPTAVLRRETAKPTLVEVALVLLAVPFAVACGWFIDRGPFKIRHWEHESCPVKGQCTMSKNWILLFQSMTVLPKESFSQFAGTDGNEISKG